MDKTIHNYIQEKKIAEAKHLLLFTDHSYEKSAHYWLSPVKATLFKVSRKSLGQPQKEFKNIHYAHALS